MRIIESPGEMTAWSREMGRLGETIALVPTMGYFHDGHLALMERAGRLASKKVVSLFVNPKQFGPGEDLDRYPSDPARDTELARGKEVDVLFAPKASSMYGPEFSTSVQVGGVSERFCGASRPGHFDGVATVVAKLFNIVRPDFAVFGEKDWQQLAVIRRMSADLNLPVEIVAHPIIREGDGLAMSSRNTYLSQEERRQAICLYRSLQLARKLVREGERNPGRLLEEVRRFLDTIPAARVDYAAIVDGRNLSDISSIDRFSLLLLAVRIGSTRLIDNGLLLQGNHPGRRPGIHI